MAPRAKWDKLIPVFNFEAWSEVGARRVMAQKNFPVLTDYYGNKLGQYAPTDVVQEWLEIDINGADPITTGKMVALQTHIRISDSANCHRLATELLMLNTDEDSKAVFVAQFVRALLSK